MSSAGPIDLIPRGWKCRNGNENGGDLVDESLRSEEKFSRTLQRGICLLGANLSFAKT